MRPFSFLYRRVMRWSAHPHAPHYLAGLSFAESTFFPVPPDVMLAPMTLARPGRWLRLALITTIASVLGGVVGWLMGYFAMELVMPMIEEASYRQAYELAREWFHDWGFWAVLLAGFSPVPYKIFTIAAGALALNLPLFVLASIIGRGGRFFLVAWLVSWGGPPVEARLKQHIDLIGWMLVCLCVLGFLIWRFW
ncbi:YqaA family protein [Natronospira bacteriovora]|uniref:YqaA family protein n=1 Tax=Natronospira bacteriovora TaxID=3069753 RepID=A0ABU0W2T5_9GAMM|nr:YqaA family protein [Natronospira sp. AB-CW4]MDQ2068313.1 YqaA family protein [Natronospira sp. AB-CW4]